METAGEIIAALEKKYKGDSEAMEVIENAKTDIKYIESKEKEGNYTGQPSTSRALEVKGTLEYWY